MAKMMMRSVAALFMVERFIEITDESRFLFLFIEFFSNHSDEEKGEKGRHAAAHNSEVHLFFDFRILFRVKIDEGA